MYAEQSNLRGIVLWYKTQLGDAFEEDESTLVFSVEALVQSTWVVFVPSRKYSG